MSRWILSKEEPDAPIAVEGRSQLGIRNPLHLAEGAYHRAESLDSCQIHIFSKMFV